VKLAFCIPGDLSLPTGGYRYDREVMVRLEKQGVSARHVVLPGSFPAPSLLDLQDSEAILSQVSPRETMLIDGLALGAMPPAIIARIPHRIVALVHHPLGLEAGLSAERAAFLIDNERSVLSLVRHIIVTSPATARTLVHDFGVPGSRLSVAEPGTERAARAAGTGKPLQILAVGAISARKAYGNLVQALAKVSLVDWRLTIAGSLTLSPSATADLRATIAREGLDDRVALTGALADDGLAQLYAQADLFAMSSLYEGYGMALTEALARGLPIVTSSGGAAVDTVPDAAALKVPPGDVPALTTALATVMTDAALRRRMADAAWAAAALLPTWDDTAATIADALKAL
jgi:glycosyltransferase involved in cell wall biosynthesis